MPEPIYEAPAATAPVAGAVAKKGLSRLIPGVGLAAGGYDAYQRAKAGDWTGAALSGVAGLSTLVPGVGTAAGLGLMGVQAARDKAKYGSYLPTDYSGPSNVLIKFQDGTSVRYKKVPSGIEDDDLSTRASKDYPGKTITSITRET